MTSNDYGSKLAFFFAGAALGAAVSLLYAPQSGRNTRKYIRKKSDEGREAITDAGKQILERGREYYDKGRNITGEAGELFARSRKMLIG